MPSEEVLFTARVHPAVFFPSVFFFVSSIASLVFSIYVFAPSSPRSISMFFVLFFFLSPGLFVASILTALEALIIILTTEFGVTNRRVIAKSGFIRLHTAEILLSKIESIFVQQSIWGRLLNMGTVTIRGTGGTKESFKGIADPTVVRMRINQIIDNYVQT